MPVHDEIGKRMKVYEYVTQTHLVRRMPVIVRVDGKAFHTFTRGLRRPFDDILIAAMQRTMKFLCENIQGCVLGYTQSDEISLLLVDYKKLDSAAWFDYCVQKCASIASSMATLEFNRAFSEAYYSWIRNGAYLDDNNQPTPAFYELVDSLEADMTYWKQHTHLPEHPDMRAVNLLHREINSQIVFEDYIDKDEELTFTEWRSACSVMPA